MLTSLNSYNLYVSFEIYGFTCVNNVLLQSDKITIRFILDAAKSYKCSYGVEVYHTGKVQWFTNDIL